MSMRQQYLKIYCFSEDLPAESRSPEPSVVSGMDLEKPPNFRLYKKIKIYCQTKRAVFIGWPKIRWNAIVFLMAGLVDKVSLAA